MSVLHRSIELLEPCDGKLSRTVLRGESARKGADLPDYKSMNLQVNAGIQNIFNAYQNDFDKGADRDSGYIYGPSLPRSFFAGVKISY